MAGAKDVQISHTYALDRGFSKENKKAKSYVSYRRFSTLQKHDLHHHTPQPTNVSNNPPKRKNMLSTVRFELTRAKPMRIPWMTYPEA